MLSLFDIQLNGFAGVDFQDPDLDLASFRRSVEILGSSRHQTRRFLLTLISDDVDSLCRKFERIESFRAKDPLLASAVVGYHLEGPFLSREEGYCGAHPPEKQRRPEIPLFERMQSAAGGNIRLLTIAPEWHESAEVIAHVCAQGVVVSLGHTNASESEIDVAISAGARLCTHLGNGVPQVLPRHDNVIQRLLARDELTACLIPDGVHLPPFMLKNLFRAKPPRKVVFTTDAVSAAGAPDGSYTVGPLRIESRDGVVRKPGSPYFAGSSLTPVEGVTKAARWLGITLHASRALFSTAPAELFSLTLPPVSDNEPPEVSPV